MIKSRYLVFFGAMIGIMLFSSGNFVTAAQANPAGTGTPTPTGTPIVNGTDIPGIVPSVAEQEELKNIIQAYIDIRYRALSVSTSEDFKQNGFSNLISDMYENVDASLNEEMAKLRVEFRRAELNGLRYIDYKYFLDFRSITIDPDTQTATISVIEASEVIFEISTELNPENPTVTRSAGIEHIIVLHKINNEWKIISDTYNDDLWRMLRRAGKSTDEILQATDEMARVLEASPRSSALQVSSSEDVSTYSLPNDPSSHPYGQEERNAAIEYAHRHWGGDNDGDGIPDALYNPNYFPYPGNDCQNFVSQALYEGGNITMFIPNPDGNLGVGDAGWFYLNNLQYASGWTDVESFFTRTTRIGTEEPETWRDIYNQGPEGTLLSERLGSDPDEVPAGLMLGDIIQFEWLGTPERPDPNGPLYDHSGIIVGFEPDGSPKIATHSQDHYDIIYTALKPWEKIRFIHIERSNGYPPVKVQTTFPNDDAGGNPSGNPCPNINYDSGNNYFGGCFSGGQGVTSGFLFRDIQIPRGAQIKYAYVTFSTDGTYVPVEGTPGVFAPIVLKIAGENSIAPIDFATPNPPPAHRTPFPTSVVWHIDATTSTADYDTWYWQGKRSTPNIKDVIHAITAQSGWMPGNKLSLIFGNGAPNSLFARRVTAYEALSPNPNGLTPARLIAAYDLSLYTPPPYNSVGAQDGIVLESKETSSVGGMYNTTATSFFVGDDGSDKQYRSVLHFDTNNLPSDAIITSVILKIKQESISGTNPFTTHYNLNVDVKKPYFGNSANLAKSDFEDTTNVLFGAAVFDPTPIDNWYGATLSSAAFPYINLDGTTQFRLYFTLDDNDDLSPDYISFFSGDNATDQPQLIIAYYVPAP